MAEAEGVAQFVGEKRFEVVGPANRTSALPQGLKPPTSSVLFGPAEQAAEKVERQFLGG